MKSIQMLNIFIILWLSTNYWVIHFAEAYHDSIHCINEFISTYDAFCSLLMEISTVDFNNITGFLE